MKRELIEAAWPRSARDPVCGAPGLLTGPFDRLLAGFLSFGAGFASGSDVFQFIVRKVFDSHHGVSSSPDADQLIQLYLDCCAVAILRVLDQEHHQKRYDRRAGVDDQLPRVRKAEQGTADRPYDDDADSQHKG